MDTIIVFAKNTIKKGSNEKNCDFCPIPYIFSDFEKDITKNIFDEVFLWEYHSKLVFHLQQVFDTDKTALCCFLDDEFHYRGRGWDTEETWSVSQIESIVYSEKLKMNELKKSASVFLFQKKSKKTVYKIYIDFI